MNDKFIKRCFVKQHDSSDCGVASLLMLLKYYGGDSSLKSLREISGTTQTGTTLLGLYQAAQKIGFSAEGAKAGGINDLIEYGKPAILSVIQENKLDHFIVCFGYVNGKFLVGDPARGLVYYSRKELEDVWSKNCLLLEPTKNLIKRTSIKQKKKEWVISLIKEDYGILISATTIGLFTSILGMVMAVFSQKLVDNVLPEKNFEKLCLGLIFVFFLLISRVLLSAIRSQMMVKQGKDFNNRIADFFYSRILLLPKAYFDLRKVGDMVARLHDTRRIQRVISSLLGDTIINVLIVVTSLVFLAIYSWQISLACLFCFPIYFIILYRRNNSIIRHQRDVMAGYAMTESNFIDTIGGITDIKSYKRESFFRQFNKNIYSQYQDKVFVLGKLQIRIGILAGIVSVIITISLLAYSCYLAFTDILTIGKVMAVVSIVGSLFPTVASLALIIIPINEAKVAFDRMYETIGFETDIAKEQNIKLCGDVINIDIKDVSFRFVGHKLLLNNVSLYCKNGTITCIVGESGCGKSTLCGLIQRFYSPETGSIMMNGVTVNSLSEAMIRDNISYVPQEVHIFNGTIIDNICLGNLPQDMETFSLFCSRYHFDELFSEFPQGLSTLAGEEGINLSGGQKQLVAFARALYKPSKVLILDELTSAMDRKTESVICSILCELKKDHTIIFITHRLEIVKRIADNIYVLEHGVVTASGCHNVLIKSKNFYSDYWKNF